MPTLDMPERPNASPCGGFFIQSRAGRAGNFEVVIPWPDGGLAHFWRENDAPGLQWHGPSIFGRTDVRYQGVSVMESDFAGFRSSSIKNLEVIAVNANGEVEHWWRENGGAFLWKHASTPFDNARGVPALAYTGALFLFDDLGSGIEFDRDQHGPSEFWLAVAGSSGGLSLMRRENRRPEGPQEWKSVNGFFSVSHFGAAVLRDDNFVGVGIALTTMSNPYHVASWRNMRERFHMCGDILVAAVSEEGALHVFVWGLSDRTPFETSFVDGTSLTLPTEHGEVLRPFRGRPSILQSDYGIDESSFFPDRIEYGNFELAVPAKDGGILYYWRMNDHQDRRPIKDGWTVQDRMGSAVYDEVSLIQSGYGNEDHCNLELVARRKDQRGFDFFWREPDHVWRGPIVVEGDASTGSVSQLLSASDTLAALHSAGIGYSVTEQEIRSWLANAEYTPYPAIAAALLTLLRNRRLSRNVPIDVIRYYYEDERNLPSPRKVEEVDLGALAASVVDTYNNEYGAGAASLDEVTILPQ